MWEVLIKEEKEREQGDLSMDDYTMIHIMMSLITKLLGLLIEKMGKKKKGNSKLLLATRHLLLLLFFLFVFLSSGDNE